jgi:hypothetical protein
MLHPLSGMLISYTCAYLSHEREDLQAIVIG